MNPFNHSALMGQDFPAANNPINPGQVQTTMPSGNGLSETQATVSVIFTPEQRQRFQQHYDHGRQVYGYILSLRNKDKLLRLEFIHNSLIEERKQRVLKAQRRLAELEELEIATNRQLAFAYSSHQNRPGDELAVQWMQLSYLRLQKSLKETRHSLQAARMHLAYQTRETLELFELGVRRMFGLNKVDPFLNMPGYAHNTTPQQMGQMAPPRPSMNPLAGNPFVANPLGPNSFVHRAQHRTDNTVIPGSYNVPRPAMNSQGLVNCSQPAVAIPNQTVVQSQQSHFEIWPGWAQEPPVAETPVQSPPIDVEEAPFNLERYLDHRAADFETFGANPIYNEQPSVTSNNTNGFPNSMGMQGHNGHFHGDGEDRGDGSDEGRNEGSDHSESSDKSSDESDEESDGEKEWEKPDDESDDDEEDVDDDALFMDPLDL